jgi:glycosyltransferase involved in cell wall biosynthesis
MRDNKIDIIFIASIWPETFSYTTEEVIKMGLPVASFDIGAPAERIAKYDKGLIISDMTAGTAVEEILKYIKK